MPIRITDIHRGLTQAEVRRRFDYLPETGELIVKAKSRRIHIDDVAGCKHIITRGNIVYRLVTISINYERYLAHRIIWLWMTGNWPFVQIDHKDRDGWNNKWVNLRESTQLENGKNLSIKKNSPLGIPGVTPDNRRGGYRARIMVNYKEIHLGNFPTIKRATVARKAAEAKYFGEFARA